MTGQDIDLKVTEDYVRIERKELMQLRRNLLSDIELIETICNVKPRVTQLRKFYKAWKKS